MRGALREGLPGGGKGRGGRWKVRAGRSAQEGRGGVREASCASLAGPRIAERAEAAQARLWDWSVEKEGARHERRCSRKERERVEVERGAERGRAARAARARARAGSVSCMHALERERTKPAQLRRAGPGAGEARAARTARRGVGAQPEHSERSTREYEAMKISRARRLVESDSVGRGACRPGAGQEVDRRLPVARVEAGSARPYSPAPCRRAQPEGERRAASRWDRAERRRRRGGPTARRRARAELDRRGPLSLRRRRQDELESSSRCTTSGRSERGARRAQVESEEKMVRGRRLSCGSQDRYSCGYERSQTCTSTESRGKEKGKRRTHICSRTPL